MRQSESAEGGAAEGLPRLPPGRHGLPREFVVKNQRDRLAAGIIQVVAERGYHEATITQIAAAAGVSRRTFYSYFKTKEECFLDTYGVLSSYLLETMADRAAGERGWPRKVRAELEALLETFADNTDLVRFSLIAPPAAGGDLARTYRSFLEQLLTTLGTGKPKSARKLSVAAEHVLAGGLAALLVDKVEAGEGRQLPELLPDLLELFLAPYLGREFAIAQARR